MTYFCDTKLKARQVFVTVELEIGSVPPFTLISDLHPKNGKKNELVFQKGKKDGFVIRYELSDPNNVYSFGTDPSEALYSTEAPGCPSEKGQWEQFYVLCIEDNGQTLVVHNKNEPANGSQDFGYTLRVTRDNGKNYIDLDPIGSNQNSNSSNNIAFIALGAFVVGAVLGALAADLTMPTVTTARVATAALVGGIIVLGIYLFLGSSRAARAA
jgi:hypothetical protein